MKSFQFETWYFINIDESEGMQKSSTEPRKFAPLYLPVDRFSHIPHWCIPVFGVFGPLIVFGPLLPDYSGYHHPLPSNPGWREARQVRTFIDFFKFNNKEAQLPFPKTMDIQENIYKYNVNMR